MGVLITNDDPVLFPTIMTFDLESAATPKINISSALIEGGTVPRVLNLRYLRYLTASLNLGIIRSLTVNPGLTCHRFNP